MKITSIYTYSMYIAILVRPRKILFLRLIKNLLSRMPSTIIVHPSKISFREILSVMNTIRTIKI